MKYVMIGCGLFVLTIVVIAAFLYVEMRPQIEEIITDLQTSTETIPTKLDPVIIITSTVTQTKPVAATDLETLENMIVPVNDPILLAERYMGIMNIPTVVDTLPDGYEVGDSEVFWVADIDTIEHFQVTTKLAYATDHLYFWIQEGVEYSERHVKNLSETFESSIYPNNRAFFGSEWIPGVDGDQHIYVIYAEGLGSSVAGYFSSPDETHPLAHRYSNAHEMFFLNASVLNLSSSYVNSVLAHEFQHMIHWYADRNETSWLNEGFSELAAHLNGYDMGGFEWVYTENPDIQLNDWPVDHQDSPPHYGFSFLFTAYFLERFGDTATQSLVNEPLNGLISVDKVLNNLKSQTLAVPDNPADTLFSDLAITLFIKNNNAFDDRFQFNSVRSFSRPQISEKIDNCQRSSLTSDVHQYGIDYIEITCSSPTRIKFTGTPFVTVVPSNPHAGSYAYWSNKGDESDMSLTRLFDFSQHTGTLTLEYWTWFDIEEGWDYIYLSSSEDGKTWTPLLTPSGTAEDPSGNSYGWGYSGMSDEWIKERIDITEFAGNKVYFRFEYVTDAAVNGEGLMVDDISIPEIGYFEDFESDSGDWEAEGFVRITNSLPQTYALGVITYGANKSVQQYFTQGENSLIIEIPFGDSIDRVILIVSGTARYTRQKANYMLEFLSD